MLLGIWLIVAFFYLCIVAARFVMFCFVGMFALVVVVFDWCWLFEDLVYEHFCIYFLCSFVVGIIDLQW